MKVKEIQKALQDKGFDPGPIDGVRGRMTIAAIKAFQTANGLEPDGIVGPITTAALAGAAVAAAEAEAAKVPPAETRTPLILAPQMPWYAEALRLIGIKEDTSAKSNPLIMGWGKTLKMLDYTSDDIPWCGLFVSHCIASQLPGEAIPNGPLLARNWQKFGVKADPQPGAVMVFWRGKKNGISGHVAFYVGEDKNAYHIVGGNQSDAVTITRMSKDRFLAARWPTSALAATGKAVMLDSKGKPLSTNEA